MGKDYYHILGVERNASEDDIKKAYRKLAHQYHPDKATGNEAKFKEVNEAYQVLSNKDKRAQYDRFGNVSDNMGGQGPMPGWEGFAGFGGQGAQWNVNFGEDMGDLGDIFETFFGGGMGGGARKPAYKRGANIEAHETITLEEAFTGVKRKLRFETYVECPHCAGLGYEKSKGLSKCTKCKGKGELREERRTILGNFMQTRVCPECRGKGEVPNEKCHECKGTGRKVSSREVDIDIAKGVEDGQVIKLAGMGEAGEFGSGTGDLYVVVRIKPHPRFERRREDLVTEKEVKVTDALLEKDIEMADIDGAKYSVKIPAGFNLSKPLKVSGRGMPRFGMFGSSRGDLYIRLSAKLPKSLSHKAKKLLEDLDKEL